MSKFFINRPIVAMVISIVMVLVGALTILSLPVAQFPNITPPEIQVLATYVGADAQTLEQAVATPIEQQMNGVDNMNYMYSLNATGNSATSLIVDFDVKTDPNTDFILTQSRETQAASQLPTDVPNYGITVRKSVTAPLMWVAIYSPHGTYDARFLANYAYINLVDPVLRSPGIGNVTVFGAGQYAMRLWVRPDQLAKLGITVPDIVSAVQAQNTVNPAGHQGFCSRNAPQSVGGGYAAQSQHRNSVRRRASETEAFKTLGRLGKPNRELSKDWGKKYQVYLLSACDIDILQAVAGHADDRAGGAKGFPHAASRTRERRAGKVNSVGAGPQCQGRRLGHRLGRRHIHQQFRSPAIDSRQCLPGERLEGGSTQILLTQLDEIYATR